VEARTVNLIDRARNVVATAQVVNEGTYYGGTIDLRETPPVMRTLFDEFEEIVDGQMFAFLDDIQERIRSLDLRAVFDLGQELEVRDLQVFPSTGEVSLRLPTATSSNGHLARDAVKSDQDLDGNPGP
jgi:hypothetical protein